jgi:hypothetical protein
VEGLVEGEEDGSGIAGVTVTIGEGSAVTTDGDGAFALDVPVDQDVALRLEKAGYVPLLLPLRIPADVESAVRLVTFPLPNDFVAGLPGEAAGSEVTAVLVELDFLSAGGGETVSLTASHGDVYVMGETPDPVAGNVAPALGEGESATVLFMDVTPGWTGITLTSPVGHCVMGSASPPAGRVPVVRGAVNFVYVECSASPRMQGEVEKAAAGTGTTSDSTRPAP